MLYHHVMTSYVLSSTCQFFCACVMDIITKYFKRTEVVQLPEEECFKVANVAVSEQIAKIRSVKQKRMAGRNHCYNNETKTMRLLNMQLRTVTQVQLESVRKIWDGQCQKAL